MVLKRFANLLTEIFNAQDDSVRVSTFAARLGGEEFLLAWTDISIDAAIRRANALCERLREVSFSDIVEGMPVTASLGLACCARPMDTGQLLRIADKCLYEAKRAGRDQVVGAELTPPDSEH